MTPHIQRLARRSLIVLALSTMAHAGTLTNKFPTASSTKDVDVYAYVGAISSNPQEFDKGWLFPVELRANTRKDWEFAVDTVLDDSFNVGDTTLRVGKGFRTFPGTSFVYFEFGEVLSTGSQSFSSGVERTFEVRAQGGWTRLGYDLGLKYHDLESAAGLSDDATTASLGYRGQFRRFNVGLDYMTTYFNGAEDQNSINLTAMFRRFDGASWYGTVQNGLSDRNKGWYFGIGYEFNPGY